MGIASDCFRACRTLLLPALLSSSPQARGGDAAPITTKITEVSVHQGTALVTRRGVVPDGGGHFEVNGLSGALIADSIRLKLDGGEANGVEVHEADRAAVPEERLAALERRRIELAHAQETAADRLALETALRARLEALLDQEATFHAREVANGRANAPVWEANYAWLDEQLVAARKSERAAQWAFESAKGDVEAADAELGQLQKGGTVRTYTVAFDVVALKRGALELELDYLVRGATWTPRYDLRADRELKQVDLVYRAEVGQQTGEDWKEVDLWLSTAEPQRGVTGPKAKTVWLALAPPPRPGRAAGELRKLGYLAGDKAKADGLALSIDESTRAAVENEGLSVRYHLARKETVESRPGAATVLVGRAGLAVTGERVCTPALDLGVWLRGRTRNTSDYVLVPGPSSVFFGNDFVGQSMVALVRPGQEFVLHLGLDAGIKVERIHVADESGTSGFFSSKKQKSDRWRIELENHGALAANTDGSVKVEVREVLPKVKDDRIDVELTGCTPKLATGGRFDRDREERGVLTWEVPVANGGKAEIDWQSKVTWPADSELATVQGGVAPVSGGSSGALLIGAIAVAAALACARRRRRRFARLPLVVVGGVGFAALSHVASAQQVVDSRIDKVTVWGSGAMVERVVALPGAGGFLIRGLPAAADPASIRVRIDGGEVVGVDVRERRERALPDERLDALRAKIQSLAREKQQLEDERAALQSLAGHLGKLLSPATSAPPLPSSPGSPAAPDEARPGARVWATERDFLATRFADLEKQTRANQWALAAKEQELAGARASLQGGEATSVVLRDVVVDAVAAGSGALECRLSYLVDAAGWAPTYEMRARKDLTNVELTYRARVWQTTAEDWKEVDLWLSTAEPRRGAAGPDPEPRWLTIRKETPAPGMAAASRLESKVARDEADDMDAAAAAAPAKSPALRAPPFAAVSDEGLSVRFHLPDRQSIGPRDGGQVVLVGRTELPLRPERTCVPALDPTVWLEAKATNSSDWTLLPGETAVHLGNDYLGKGTLALTRKGQEFDVALGPDPFVTVERVALEDQLQSSAFSSKGTLSHAFRVKFENHGAPSTARDGAITVKVVEALPRSRDERITVRLESARPEPSNAKEDQKLRDDQSLLTWRLALPRAGKAEIEWRFSARFPENERLFTSTE